MRTKRTLFWRVSQVFVRPVAAVFFRLQVYGHHHVPKVGGVLIVSNHQSYLDPILLPLWLDRPLNYIAKSQLFRNPFFGWFLRSTLNAFPVRQGRGDVRAVKETIQRLRNGHLMNIYPEGSRTSDGKIAPLERGVALIVARAHVPVIPAVIVGAFEAWPIHRRFPRCRPIRIQFGPPLDLTGLEQQEILARIDQSLREMHAELSAKAV